MPLAGKNTRLLQHSVRVKNTFSDSIQKFDIENSTFDIRCSINNIIEKGFQLAVINHQFDGTNRINNTDRDRKGTAMYIS